MGNNMREKDRFDLEQEIMSCWHIVEDLQVLLDKWDSTTEDEKLNIIIGLSSLYQLKFDAMFNTFEQCIRKEEFKPFIKTSLTPYEDSLNRDHAEDVFHRQHSLPPGSEHC